MSEFIPKTDADWDALRGVAKEALTHSYSPYSNFPVGVAAIVDDDARHHCPVRAGPDQRCVDGYSVRT